MIRFIQDRRAMLPPDSPGDRFLGHVYDDLTSVTSDGCYKGVLGRKGRRFNHTALAESLRACRRDLGVATSQEAALVRREIDLLEEFLEA